ncbi:MAG TPA: carboxypeptidase-like regulatory domain-containing protein [Candidatus Acidoferrum sp.]
MFLLFIGLGSLFYPAASAQVRSELKGIVTTEDGQPISGVLVYGSESKVCCPFKREQTKTDEKGEFRLANPGDVIHLLKDSFEPSSLVVPPRIPNLKIILKKSSGEMLVPTCFKPRPHLRRISWGKFGLQFDVETRNLRIFGGKPDVDYVRYLVKPKSGNDYLELWFGPYAMSPDPDDDHFIHSVSFRQRDIVDSAGGRLGLDSSGKLESGELWRQTFIVSQGARYRTHLENAALFDHVIESACYIPYPKN